MPKYGTAPIAHREHDAWPVWSAKLISWGIGWFLTLWVGNMIGNEKTLSG
jgi:hypothetical protein